MMERRDKSSEGLNVRFNIRKLYHRRILALISGLLLWPMTAFADEKNLVVTVGEWPPYISQDLPNNGVVSEIIAEVFSNMEVKATIRFLPWGRAYEDTALGKYGATGVWMHKQEREVDFLYSDPVLTEEFVFFHRKSFMFDWENIENLKGLNIGGGIKYSYGVEFDSALAAGQLKLERINDIHLNFKKLLSARIMLYPQEKNVGYSDLKKYHTYEEQQQITHHPKPLLNNLSYVLFPRSLPESAKLVTEFNEQLKLLRESGVYDQYMKSLNAGAS